MKRLSEVAGLPLQWMQPSAGQETYELHASDDLLITLGWYLAVMMHQDSSAAAVVVAA